MLYCVDNIHTGGYTNLDTLLVSDTNINTRTCQKLTFIIANTVIGNTVAIANSIHILYAVLFYTEKYDNFNQFRFRSLILVTENSNLSVGC